MSLKLWPVSPSQTKEAFLSTNTVKTKALYIVIVIALIIIIALLPIIKVSLSVQGRGIIRPVSEKTELKALQSELVVKVCITEGQNIAKDDTLLVLRQGDLIARQNYLNIELNKRENFVNDLNILLSKTSSNLSSAIYTQQLLAFSQECAELDSEIEKAEKELNRNSSLFEKEIISQKQFDDLNFNIKQLLKKKDIQRSNQLSIWQSDLVRNNSEIADFRKQIEQLKKERQFYTITSPVSGTIEEFSGIYAGSVLQSGQTIAVISPKSDKIAEIYVSAKDIGYLSEGQNTKIQVDAFNYNQWGILNGVIIDISDDFILADNIPVFNVKCKLDRDYMQLNNGVKGNIKKGMTVNARFMIAKRSLFQLLYQKSDDWINPSRNLVAAKI
jgi:membrane fusion protein, peptide pheromone/bacteriocin exporter